MALIKYGVGIAQISGSVGGTVFSRNTYGNYIRNRTTPINPQTSRQTEVRAAIAYLAAYWAQTLTDAERTAWNLYAASVVMKNRLGEDTYLSGYNMFLRSNSLAKRATYPVFEPGPTTFELPAQDPTLDFTATEAGQTISVTFDDAMTWCNENSARMYVFQGSPQNAQRNFFDGPWRYLTSIDGSATSAITSPQVLPVEFAIAQDQRDWVYARIQRGDGRLTEPFRANAFVGA